MPLTFPTSRILQQEPDRIACAVRDVRMAGADFLIAANSTHDLTTVLRLRTILQDAILELSAIESSLLDRADRLCAKD